MAPQIMSLEKGGQDFPAKLTTQVVVCSIIAAFGGLMFGYDIGISGGVTSMDDFLLKFFPVVYTKKHRAKENNYCKYDNQLLQLFTSSLYLAAVVCCFFASKCCKKFGRKPTMQLAAFFFFIGVILDAAAMNLPMLIVGRLCLGAGVGFGNQAVPLFISEIAPPKYRGGLNICFQMLITLGILCANIVNYFTSKLHPYGWRISLGGAAVPAIILGLGSLIIVETPTSLIERGKKQEGLKALKKIRGVEDVQKEYDEILQATEVAKKIDHPFRNLMKRSSRPQLICGTILQVFQQFTGINVIMFYAPVLFQTMGLGGDASLLSSVVTGSINSASTLVAIFGVDIFGRRALLIEAAIQMLISQVITGVMLEEHLKATNSISKVYAYIVVVLICVFVSGFAWSWGPLGWLIPSEIFPLETRTAGFFFAVSVNMIFTFLIAQAFLTMLCHMKSGIFFFFAAWIVIMGCWAVFFLPETKGIPIDEMNERAWKKHWFWKKYFNSDDEAIKPVGDKASTEEKA
ncbi:sugar transport 8-like [Olea europaea subsp. europaea]|uniref:Sugar transport 8-like n=1 Tax=Olea europaea subsp. europaea TaxID=158383 RepID=A0A8S0PJI5_OLEEU|nr:sugar transport 8-like [Olea europaea subsp. europaea]CAA2953625.1 sugar transport 8-like [Olea europaea subsp. europaea]